jgi:maleylacetoacetate isomerase
MALAFKKISAKHIPVDLLSGESESAVHTARHPMGYVPVLDVKGDDGVSRKLVQSIAIFEWLEEKVPHPSLYSGDSWRRAHIRALVETINADTQPILNIPVVDMVVHEVPGMSEAAVAVAAERRKAWYQHFIRRGLEAYSKLATPMSGRYSVGSQVTAADLVLVPQCYTATRWGVPLSEFPLVERINAAMLELPEVQETAPDRFKPA